MFAYVLYTYVFIGWTKKTTVAAMYLVAYCVGNIIGAQGARTLYYLHNLLTVIQDPRLSDRKMPPSTDQVRLPSWFAGHCVS
jgi:hypothetical protein